MVNRRRGPERGLFTVPAAVHPNRWRRSRCRRFARGG